jgi:hypothetical protein
MTTGLPSLDRSTLHWRETPPAPIRVGGVLKADGFIAGIAHEPALEVEAPASPEHLIIITLSRRSGCEGEVDGRSWRPAFEIGTAIVLPAGTPSRWRHCEPGASPTCSSRRA